MVKNFMNKNELDFKSTKNVFHYLEEDLFKSNKMKKPTWLISKGGGLITTSFGYPDTFDFELCNGSGIKYSIRLRHPSFWEKLKYLFSQTEQFWEVYCFDDEASDKWVDDIDKEIKEYNKVED